MILNYLRTILVEDANDWLVFVCGFITALEILFIYKIVKYSRRMK